MCLCVSGHAPLHRLISRRRRQPIKLLVLLLLLLFLLDQSGLHRHLLEIDYESGFSYPLEGNVAAWVDRLMYGAKDGDLGEIPSPLRQFDHSILIDAVRVCRNSSGSSDGKPSLVLVVKSACDHILNRAAIRHTWCQVQNRYHGSVQCVFVVARSPGNSALERKIQLESNEHGDMVLADLVDSYFNNTLKSMAAFRWTLDRCTSTSHFLFVDDDFYVSVPNLLRLISAVSEDNHSNKKVQDQTVNKYSNSHDKVAHGRDSLLLGYVFHSAPHRHRLSKWYVSLSEYPYSLWPPYCTAGAFILSRSTLHRLVLASRFTRYFRFDDVYIGILAKKLGIRPRHTDLVRFYPEEYDERLYASVVAAHGYGDPELLEQFWHKQHRLGVA